MPQYTQQLASDFFFAFDNYFLWESGTHPELLQAYGQAFGADQIDGFYNQFRKKRKAGKYPGGLIQYFKGRKEPVAWIMNKQVEMLDNFFGGDIATERLAFIDFGQGILFDERRATERYKDGTEYFVIHTMDAKYDPGGYVPPIGYHRWFGFLRVHTLLNNLSGRYLELMRSIALAWQIQSILKPKGTSPDGKNPNNQTMEAAKLKELKDSIEKMSLEELDAMFDHQPYPDSLL